SKLAKVEIGEARQRLLGDTVLSTRHGPSPLADSFGRSQPVNGPTIGILASRHLATGVTQAGNGRPHGMRQPTKPLTDLRDGSAFGSLEHADQLRALGAGWRGRPPPPSAPRPTRGGAGPGGQGREDARMRVGA